MNPVGRVVRAFPTRLHAVAAPIGVAAVGIGALALLHLRDPHNPGSYGVCPMYALTGLWCPGCGGLRAVNDLANFEIGSAVSSNVLVVVLVFVLAIAWGLWLRRRWRGVSGRMIVLSRAATISVFGVLIAFTVVRNSPWGSWFAPA